MRRYLPQVGVQILCAASLAVLPLTAAIAQRGGGRGRGGGGNGFGNAFNGNGDITNIPYDGRYTFVRLTFTGLPGQNYYKNEDAWSHGFFNTDDGVPAEANLMKIIQAVSTLSPHVPQVNAFAMTDPELFKYPVAFMTESGYLTMSDSEVKCLRKYLTKGGFLILDDFRDGRFPGNMGWANMEANFKRVLPGLHWIDMTPDMPIFHSFFDIDTFNNLPVGYDQRLPTLRALFEDNDPKKRVIVMADFNADIGDFWEYSGTGTSYAPDATNDAFKLGVNYLFYALTH